MSIQASMNQLLTTATIGAGLYTQSPRGKERAEIESLQRKQEKAHEVYSKGLKEAQAKDAAAKARGEKTSYEKEFLDKTGRRSLEQSALLAEKLTDLAPSEANLETEAQERLALEADVQAQKEENAQKAAAEKAAKEKQAIRESILEGVPTSARVRTPQEQAEMSAIANLNNAYTLRAQQNEGVNTRKLILKGGSN